MTLFHGEIFAVEPVYLYVNTRARPILRKVSMNVTCTSESYVGTAGRQKQSGVLTRYEIARNNGSSWIEILTH